MTVTRQPYFVNTLIDVVLPLQTVRVPGELRGDVVLFPRPTVVESGRLTTPNVALDTGEWFVHDRDASTLPASCPSQRAAQLMADTWVDNVSTQTIDPTNARQVSNWCQWFVDAHPDCAVLTPLPEPAVDAMTMAGDVWPSGTDAEAAAALTTTLPELGQNNEIEASPDEGQADAEMTEAAS